MSRPLTTELGWPTHAWTSRKPWASSIGTFGQPRKNDRSWDERAVLHGSFLCESWAMTVAADPGCWRSDMVDARASSVARQSLFPTAANTSGVIGDLGWKPCPSGQGGNLA
jgi:hypothetical protein